MNKLHQKIKQTPNLYSEWQKARTKKRWENKNQHIKQKEVMKLTMMKYFSNPDNKIKASLRSKKQWGNPIYKEYMKNASIRYWTKEKREQFGKESKERWKTDSHREFMKTIKRNTAKTAGWSPLERYKYYNIKECILYIIILEKLKAFKIGVTKELKRRIYKGHLITYKEFEPKILLLERGDIETICSLEYNINKKIGLQQCQIKQIQGYDGWSEVYDIKYLPKVLDLIDTTLNL